MTLHRSLTLPARTEMSRHHICTVESRHSRCGRIARRGWTRRPGGSSDCPSTLRHLMLATAPKPLPSDLRQLTSRRPERPVPFVQGTYYLLIGLWPVLALESL